MNDLLEYKKQVSFLKQKLKKKSGGNRGLVKAFKLYLVQNVITGLPSVGVVGGVQDYVKYSVIQNILGYYVLLSCCLCYQL